MEFGGVSVEALSPFPLACTPRAFRVPKHRASHVSQELATQATDILHLTTYSLKYFYCYYIHILLGRVCL